MGTDENQKVYKQEKFRSLTPHAIIIDENQERVEWGRREERWSTSSITHAMARDEASKEVTHKRARVSKLLVGYQDLGALNALRHP
jgi:hypothetical protein